MKKELDLRPPAALPKNVTVAAPAGLVAARGGGSLVTRALDFVRNQSGELGLVAAQTPEFAVDPHVLQTSGGASAVNLQQQYKGIPIFQATQTVRFDGQGTISQAIGATTPIVGDIDIRVSVRPEEAAQIAARHVTAVEPGDERETDAFGQPIVSTPLDVRRYNPAVIAAFRNLAMQPTVLDAGPFDGAVLASLIWFQRDTLSLAWEVILSLPNSEGQYRLMVDANDRTILFASQLLRQIAARGHCFERDGSAGRAFVDFPKPVNSYGLPTPPGLPPTFPGSWLDGTATSGNAAVALASDTGRPLTGTAVGGVLTFDPVSPGSMDQYVLNLFYFNCFLHDYFYLLGFREAEGNFQQDNFSSGGLPGDRVQAKAYPGPVAMTANMSTPADGTAPVMSMGLVTASNRHTALDATVVIHEFSHGVTTRLVGGPLNNHALDAPQSLAMGEGWGDYFACTVTDAEVVAAWVVNDQAGIRGLRYDAHFPDHFGMIGTGRYNEIHNVGEIWCATLLDINRRIGAPLAVQLVVDGLKLSPSTPTFLDMRDAMLGALRAKATAGQLPAGQADTLQAALWQSFAKFGMGPAAQANDGPAFSGVVADFTAPGQPATPVAPPAPVAGGSVKVTASPSIAIPDAIPAGVKSTVQVGRGDKIQHLRLTVSIQHSYAGDLRIQLSAPDGSTFLVKKEGIDATQNLNRTYSETDVVAFGTMIGRSGKGVWTLTVADMYRTSLGKLLSWGLELDF